MYKPLFQGVRMFFMVRVRMCLIAIVGVNVDRSSAHIFARLLA
jgi:hypothetical protein